MPGKLSRAGNKLALTGGLGSAAAAAAGQFIALLTTAPSDHALGAEYAATGYARQAVTWAAPTDADPPVVVNTGAIVFGPMTALTGATITHAALMDADSSADGGNPDTAANMLAYWTLDVSKTPDAGDNVDIADGALSLEAN